MRSGKSYQHLFFDEFREIEETLLYQLDSWIWGD